MQTSLGRAKISDASLLSCALVRKVVETAAEYYNLKVAQLLGRRRPAQLAWARQVAMLLAMAASQSSSGFVGECFKGRDHGTVLHACLRVRTRMTEDPEVEAEVRRLSDRLRINWSLVANKDSQTALVPQEPAQTAARIAFPPFIIAASTIRKAVAAEFNVRPVELEQYSDRHERVAFPRQVAMYLDKELNCLGRDVVANHFNGGSPSNVSYACGEVQRKVDEDPALASIIKRLRQKLCRETYLMWKPAAPVRKARQALEIDPQMVKSNVASSFLLGTEQLEKPGRKQTIAFARQVAMVLYHRIARVSMEDVGNAFGGMHHTNVLHAKRKVLAITQENRRFSLWLGGMERFLRDNALSSAQYSPTGEHVVALKPELPQGQQIGLRVAV